MAEVEYFGVPGTCFDIDGDWWHEPGSVTFDPVFDRWLFTGEGPMPTGTVARKCCGVVGVDDVVLPAAGLAPTDRNHR